MRPSLATDSDKCKTTPKAHIPDILRAHVGKPSFALLRQLVDRVIHTRSNNYEPHRYIHGAILNKLGKSILLAVHVEHLRHGDDTIGGVDDDHVQTSVMAVLVDFDLHLLFIQAYFGQVPTLIPR